MLNIDWTPLSVRILFFEGYVRTLTYGILARIEYVHGNAWQLAMHSYYRQGFGKAPSERTKEAQAIL